MATSYGLDLFDLQFRRESVGWVLRVVLDRVPAASASNAQPEHAEPGLPPDGESVTIEDCQRVSHDLSALLDVEGDRLGLPDVKYTLEVSSPGLDRPLRGEADYRRFDGRLAKIVTSSPVEGQSSFSGRLAGMADGCVLVNEGRRMHRVPVTLIKRARLDVEF